MVEAHGSRGADNSRIIFQTLAMSREEYKRAKGFLFIFISTLFICLVLQLYIGRKPTSWYVQQLD